jgi:AGCS family alanine or glycine:cation symporter
LNHALNKLQYIVESINALLGHILVPCLLLAGLYLTLRLGFIQIRKLWHGILVTAGYYDDDTDSGDVSHFQALSTALSATVGVGNIAGVAMAIHWGGPGALFWMWVTAFLGQVLKYSECTLALAYRRVSDDPEAMDKVSGGPMYYMADGLKMRPMAVLFAACMMFTTFVSGSAVQANSFAHSMNDSFGMPYWLTGLLGAIFVGTVILGGISRIGAVASILTPTMACTYVFFALLILGMNPDSILPAFQRIFTEAFNPVAGVTGAGTASLLMAVQTGVRRGLYSSEGGAGSAPIAHAAARTDEPVSEGTVALLEPFIDTLIVCTLTGLVLITTNVWDERFHIELHPAAITIQADSVQVVNGESQSEIVYNGSTVGRITTDWEGKKPYTGVIKRLDGETVAQTPKGEELESLYGEAVQVGAPLTAKAYERGLAPLGDWGSLVVTICIGLFALSTALGASYYGDRCAAFLFGTKAVMPYRIGYCIMYLVGAVSAVPLLWKIVDMAFALATLPNVAALMLMSGTIKKLTDSYYTRKPWLKHKESDRKS